MNRYIFLSKIFILGLLFFSFQQGFAQSSADLEALLKKYNVELSEIPPETLSQLETRVSTLQAEGRTESEIVQALREEGLIPTSIPGVSQDSLSVQPGDSSQISPVSPPNQVDEDRPDDDADSTQIPTPILPTERPKNLIFGHEIFYDTTGAFIRALPATPADNYLIGPGDLFNVTIWGCSELSESLVVDADGSVFRPYLGKIYVGGLTYVQAQNALTRNYLRYVADCSTIEVFMGRSKRTININIVGEVARPGGYKINGAMPAFNALFQAGGITEKGSIRNISVKRNGKVVQILDVYEYLIGGEDDPIFLQDNDFIFVPVQDKIVQITGAVEREARYELREDEHLKSLILFSGGLSFFARTEKARLDRFELGERKIISFELQNYIGENSADFTILEGDKIHINAQNLQLRNFVEVKGQVKFPDIYQFNPGDRVADLVDRAGGLEEDALMDQAYLIRKQIGSYKLEYIPLDVSQIITKNPNINVPLQNRDVLHIFSNKKLNDDRKILISGEIRNPGFFQNSNTLNLRTLLFLSDGLKKTANYQNIELRLVPEIDELSREEYIDFLEKQDPSSASYKEKIQFQHRVSVEGDWQTDTRLDSILLFPFNHIHIYSTYDFVQYQQVAIQGAVESPGQYRLLEGMNLKDLLYQSGGLISTFDKVEVELHKKVTREEKGNFGTKPTDNEIIRLSMGADWEQVAELDDVSLEDIEKVIVVPDEAFAEPTFIHIKGEVHKPGRYPLVPNMTLKDLIYLAEGFRIDADFENIELTRIIEVENNGNITPVPVGQQIIEVQQDWQKDESLDEVFINAFDQVFIRKNPDFLLQESIFIFGEVQVPGEYNKIRKFERLSSLVKRAKGPTELAYLEGAQILRRNTKGPISLKLKKALANPGGRFDIPLLDGDTLKIPPVLNTVTINGNVLKPGVNIVYEKRKQRYKYYVNKYAGGFAKRTQRRNNTITYVDGTVRGPSRFLWKKLYPKVKQGAVIEVAAKPEKIKKDKDPDGGARFNSQEVVASLTAVVTFILLLRNTLNN